MDITSSTELSWVSIIGHAITFLCFLSAIIYTYLRRNELRRSTQQSTGLFYAIIGTSVLFGLLNLFRMLYELFGQPENLISKDIDLIAQFSSIFILSLLILFLLSNKIVVERYANPARVLAIGAHPDDIEIAAGGTLAKMRDAGNPIAALVLTQGEKGGNAELRQNEAKSGAVFLGLDDIQVLDCTDTRLMTDAVDVTNAIEEMIQKTKPDIIFTHSNHDIHQDHQLVYEATLRAARDTRTTILCYESPSVTQDFRPTYFVEVGDYVDIKIQAVKEHRDQRKKSYMRADLIRSKLTFRGGQAKVEYAEGFEVVRMISML
jgi:LmbE family N-acetylglucosaminyl deacetylase